MGLSPRLAAIVDALPLRPDSRVLEIGCGPGAAARAVADRLTSGDILATDRSAKAIDIVFAIRVGALDGRHPSAGRQVMQRLAAATTPTARLFIDGGSPLRELPIAR